MCDRGRRRVSGGAFLLEHLHRADLRHVRLHEQCSNFVELATSMRAQRGRRDWVVRAARMANSSSQTSGYWPLAALGTNGDLHNELECPPCVNTRPRDIVDCLYTL